MYNEIKMRCTAESKLRNQAIPVGVAWDTRVEMPYPLGGRWSSLTKLPCAQSNRTEVTFRVVLCSSIQPLKWNVSVRAGDKNEMTGVLDMTDRPRLHSAER